MTDGAHPGSSPKRNPTPVQRSIVPVHRRISPQLGIQFFERPVAPATPTNTITMDTPIGERAGSDLFDGTGVQVAGRDEWAIHAYGGDDWFIGGSGRNASAGATKLLPSTS